MLFPLLADAPPDLRAELSGVVMLLVVAVIKAIMSHLDAKQAAQKANTEAEKAAAAAAAEKAATDTGKLKQAALDAVVLGIEAYKRKLSEGEAKKTSQTIKAFTTIKGVEDIVHDTVHRLTKDPVPTIETPVPPPSTSTSPFPTRPPAGLIMLVIPLALLGGGCVSARIHEHAQVAKVATEQLHDTSAPAQAWVAKYLGKPDGKGGVWTEQSLTEAWQGLWAALERANAAVEEASR